MAPWPSESDLSLEVRLRGLEMERKGNGLGLAGVTLCFELGFSGKRAAIHRKWVHTLPYLTPKHEV